MTTYNNLTTLYQNVLDENNELKKNIRSLRDILCSEICKHFEMTNNIKGLKNVYKDYFINVINMCTYNDLRILYQNVLDENTELKKNIHSLRDLLCSEICKYFEITNNIKALKKRFCYNNYHDCYIDLVYYYGSDEPVRNADDFKECYEDIFGKPYPNYNNDDNNNDKNDNETK